MRVLEIQVERKVVKWCKEHGILNLKLEVPGSTGWPDRLIFIPGGRPLLIEFKKPGEELEPKQRYVHSILKGLGYQVEVHDDVESAIQTITRAVEQGCS